MKILSVSYSFAYFLFFGFHEILKNKNTKDHFEHMRYTSIASGYFISIILHHTVTSAHGRHQHSIASDHCINVILLQTSVLCNGTINHHIA